MTRAVVCLIVASFLVAAAPSYASEKKVQFKDAAQAAQEVTVDAGRPLRVALDNRVPVKEEGQAVMGTLLNPVYVGTNLAIPAGVKVRGHVAAIHPVPKTSRIGSMMNGNFSPPHAVMVQFDTLVLADHEVPVVTVPVAGEPLTRESTVPPPDGVLAQAGHDVAEQAKQTLATITEPNRKGRLKQYLVGRLPFHRQYINVGTVFTAALAGDLTLTPAARLAVAPDGTAAAAESILTARLLTGLDSLKTARGTVVNAVVTEPLLSPDGGVILPEGTMVTGTVTLARGARSFRRNGQLRFVFESITIPHRPVQPLRASLQAAEVAGDQRLSLDEEGGATILNSKTRFVAPALAVAVALLPVANTEISDEALGAVVTEPNLIGRGLKGLSGFGLVGVVLSMVSRPVAIASGVLGAGQAVYVHLIGRGRDVIFPPNTPIRVRLSPGSAPTR